MISLLALKQLLEQFMMMLFIPKGVMIYYIYSQRSDGAYKNFRGKHYNEKEVELAKKVAEGEQEAKTRFWQAN